MILRTDEFFPPIFLCDILTSTKLVCVHWGYTDVSYFAHRYQIWSLITSTYCTMERFHYFFTWKVVISAMNLDDINIIHTKMLDACVNSPRDMCGDTWSEPHLNPRHCETICAVGSHLSHATMSFILHSVMVLWVNLTDGGTHWQVTAEGGP
jgi:hypothetical protein